MRICVRTLAHALAIGAGSILLAEAGSAAPVHYWRFEDASGYLADSVGSANLTAGAGVAQVTLPDGIRGADFPIGLEASNAPGTSTGWLQTVLPAAMTSSFTVEAFVHADALGGFYGDLIAGAVTDPSLVTSLGWMFQARFDGFNGTAFGELAMALAQGGSFSFVNSTFVLTPGNDYYVAAAVDIPGGTVTFYRQNLTTGGPLQMHVGAHTRTALNNNTSMRIGATTVSSFDFAFDGLIDEVRLSTGVVAPSALLIAVPEPSTAGLLALGLLALGLRQRRG